jgi:hypothetical protein
MRKADINHGDRYGRLVIIQEAPKRGNFRYFECKCDCGNMKVVAMGALRKGVTKSCGCLMSEAKRMEKPCKWTENHEHVGTRLYRIWTDIKKRCLNSKSNAYKWYGGRGITICNDWSNRFLAFREWALQNGYSDNLTIDRVDVNGNYEPANCRWITIQEQQKNRRK